MHCWTIIAAGGHGLRLARPEDKIPKQFMLLDGRPLYWSAALPFIRTARVRGLVFVFPAGLLEDARAELAAFMEDEAPSLPWICVSGGESRRESVFCGLQALPKECDTVLIQDAARPFTSPQLVNRVLDGLNAEAGVIPGLLLTDTIKQVDEDWRVQNTPDRASLRAVQTPQGFRLSVLRQAHQYAAEMHLDAPDDAALLEALGHRVLVVPGEEGNRKITTRSDLALLIAADKKDIPTAVPCTGLGYDVHRYGGDRPLILGGVPIPCDLGVFAHSDGDTLLHALADAILGCIGKTDIGELFPDKDPAFERLPSGIILAEALRLAERAGFSPTHVDCTIVAQVPRLSPHREGIRKNLAKMLGLELDAVSVKATTEEKLGFTGAKEGLKAYALVSGLRKR